MRSYFILLFLITSFAPSSVFAEVPDLRTRKFGSDWPQFLGPTGNSVSPESGINTKWDKKGPPIVWFKKLGTGYSAPVTVFGRLFIFDRVKDKARLRCLNSETGKQIWEFKYTTDYVDKYNYNNGPRCSPVVDGDRVYIHGVEGMLHCLKVLDGNVVWKLDTQKRFNFIQNFFGVGSTPVIEGDLLIANIGGSPENTDPDDFANVKGNNSGVVAFNKYNGKVVYRITDELASYSSPHLATIKGRRWGFMFARGGLIGFEPRKGKVDFYFPFRAKDFESVNAANPVVVGDKVLISETYGPGSALLQVKPGGKKVIWSDADKSIRRKSLQCHWNTPIFHKGYVYGCSGRHTNNADLRCIEWKTGKVMWTKERTTRCSLLKVGDRFICQGEYGFLLVFDANPEKFEIVSLSQIEGPKAERLLQYPCWAAPVLSHGLLYVRGKDYLVCLDLKK